MSIITLRSATALFALFLSTSVSAQNVVFSQISKNDFEQIAREVSANFTHTSVSGASSLGSVLGLQFGLVLGQTKTPNLNTLVKRGDPNLNVDEIIHGGLLGQVSIPAGVTFEGLILPSVGSADFKARNTSLGVKWTLTQLLLDLPVDVAVKAFYTKASLHTKQRVGGVDQTIDFDDKMLGFAVLVSKNLGIVEPYFGLLQNKATSDMSYNGGANIFSSTYTTSQSASVNLHTTGYVLGAEVKLLFFNAGAEFTRIFGTNRYTAKLAFSF